MDLLGLVIQSSLVLVCYLHFGRGPERRTSALSDSASCLISFLACLGNTRKKKAFCRVCKSGKHSLSIQNLGRDSSCSSNVLMKPRFCSCHWLQYQQLAATHLAGLQLGAEIFQLRDLLLQNHGTVGSLPASANCFHASLTWFVSRAAWQPSSPRACAKARHKVQR